MAVNPIQHVRTKQIEIDVHFIREQITKGCTKINHIPAYYQRADTLTKPLFAPNFA